MHEPTVDPIGRAAVLEGLSTYPQTLDQIAKHVTLSYRDQTASVVAALVSDGTAEDHGDGTYSLN